MLITELIFTSFGCSSSMVFEGLCGKRVKLTLV